MGNWGIATTAPVHEKIKSEMADFLNGLNSCGDINYDTYNQLFDFSMALLDKMYQWGKVEKMNMDGDEVPALKILKQAINYNEDGSCGAGNWMLGTDGKEAVAVAVRVLEHHINYLSEDKIAEGAKSLADDICSQFEED